MSGTSQSDKVAQGNAAGLQIRGWRCSPGFVAPPGFMEMIAAGKRPCRRSVMVPFEGGGQIPFFVPDGFDEAMSFNLLDEGDQILLPIVTGDLRGYCRLRTRPVAVQDYSEENLKKVCVCHNYVEKGVEGPEENAQGFCDSSTCIHNHIRDTFMNYPHIYHPRSDEDNDDNNEANDGIVANAGDVANDGNGANKGGGANDDEGANKIDVANDGNEANKGDGVNDDNGANIGDEVNKGDGANEKNAGKEA